MLDTEPAHCTVRARDSLTANSSDRLESSLLSLGVTRFRATTAAVISFFITESLTVRGLVGDMNDGRYMMSGEGRAVSSPRFKSKRRSEGPDIFSEVVKKEEVGQVKIVEMQREFLQAEIQVCFERPAYLYKNQHAMEFKRSKRQFQISKRPTTKIKEALAFSKAELAQKSWAILYSRFVRTRHMQPLHSTELRDRRGKLRNRRGICFSRRVNICHMQSLLCRNYGQSVEDLW
ncbi:hypothetical protein C1H46_038085 [Malus baccata]|uniref:Uncharacterized protein n=1 Tax=Malus baccata TaxID=106549 RepID=A0A540KQ79_MALBA|nr:hypothetical protein C1H46_038085 [Malus baccata]